MRFSDFGKRHCRSDHPSGFLDAALFESSSVDVVPTADGRLEAAQVRWTSSSEPATLFLVAIDNDGGVAWQSLSL